MDVSFGVPQSGGGENKICPLSGIQHPFPGHPAPRLVTMLTELIGLIIKSCLWEQNTELRIKQRRDYSFAPTETRRQI